MQVSPYLIIITVILALAAGFIYYTQHSARKTIRVHDSSAIIPDPTSEPLPIVTESPYGFDEPIMENTEGFVNGSSETRPRKAEPCSESEPPTKGWERGPAPANPFMNVLIPEIKYDPERPEAASVEDPAVKQQLDDMFRTNFFNDPTDVFGKSQDQRQFITMPSTSIPNDRDSFMKWCYNIVPQNCKSGGREACLPGTDGGPITSLNQNF
jgi:hypothetical protein